MADSFDDYRPCRPKDFVGRKATQNKVYEFLERVRNKENTTRIICFRGLSGHGKSSIVIKLSDEFRKKKNRDKYFLYPIDVRSARSPLFVAKAVRTALQQAVDENFIVLPGHRVSIGSTSLLLSSESVKALLVDLESKKRLIIIFFDQFEELFTKESLSDVFDAFNYLALEIDSFKANIVLGFSWRTGLNPPEDHKAFSFWHNLRDKRYELPIEPFTKEEAPQLLTNLSEHIGERLNERLRKRLLNDSQRLPWLLKKLSIHVYQQINNGVTQLELLSKQFNISSLFDDDLGQLSKSERICLQYIAANSPADTIDVTEKFRNIPDRLIENRLIVKIGQNYTLYWDIFRDYLLNKTIPTVYWKYVPRTQLTVVLKAIELLQNNSMDSTELATQINYQQKSCSNLILDLQNFFLAKREQNDQNLITVQAELQYAKSLEIADYLSKQLNEHIIVQKLRETVAVGEKISPEKFRRLFERTYPEKKITSKQTLETYCRRMVQWLIFAGLLERRNKSIIRPLEDGAQKGVFPTEQQELSDTTQLTLEW
jgi:predicted transcriptional regulator